MRFYCDEYELIRVDHLICGSNVSGRMRRKFYLILLLVVLPLAVVRAQYTQGVSGLLTIPTAELNPDGTFMGGANFMPMEITPETWDYDTANYFLSITFLPFLEVGYLCTLFHFDDGTWNQDRALSLRLRPIKEGRWWPSIAVGTSDALSVSQRSFNPSEEVSANRYYGSVYGVATKNFRICKESVAVTIGYSYKTQEHSYRDGLMCGVSYSPTLYPDAKLMADLSSNAVSVGAAVKLFNHLSINAFCYDWSAFVGGLRYEVKLY